MKSDHVTPQESKESKIFEFFSTKLELPRIETGPNGKYPDGILELDGKLIAIEQTDFYLIKQNGKSCNMAFLSCLQLIRHDLELKGHTGCIGIKPRHGVIRKNLRSIKPQLEEEIQRYIEGDTSIKDTSELIECIEYCPNRNPGKLIIKPYVCDIDGAIVFCEYINPELVLNEALPKKEEKLLGSSNVYDQHWLIISLPWNEYIFTDDRNIKPVETYFKRVFIHEAPDTFHEIPTLEKIVK